MCHFPESSPVRVLGSDGVKFLAEGWLAGSDSGWPTIVASGPPLRKGKWYFEATVCDRAGLQVGWAGPSFIPTYSCGVGDLDNSWGYDVNRMVVWVKGTARPFGRHWSVGSVIGCAIDMTSRTISYSLDGDWGLPMGVACSASDIDSKSSGRISVHAAASFSGSVRLSFVDDQPLHFPPPAGYLRVRQWIKQNLKGSIPPTIPTFKPTMLLHKLLALVHRCCATKTGLSALAGVPIACVLLRLIVRECSYPLKLAALRLASTLLPAWNELSSRTARFAAIL